MRVILLAPYAPGVRVEEQGRAGVSKEVPVGGPLSGDSDRLSGEIRESEGNQPPSFEEMMAVIERRRR